MGGITKIEWADCVINPIQDVIKGKSGRGYHCTKVSPGCDHCYAEGMNNRFGNSLPFDGRKAKFELIQSELEKPLHWKKSRRIFVQSMGDLFHEDVSDFDIFRVVKAMHRSNFNGNKHTFILLTKRPERMAAYFADFKNNFGSGSDYKFYEENPSRATRNMWLGVTAENQEQADKRIPILLQIPAAVRFVSVEPMLGPVDLLAVPCGRIPGYAGLRLGDMLHWCIAGGESGPKARPVHPDWVRSLRDQCINAGIPFFFKHWGEWLHHEQIQNDIYNKMFAGGGEPRGNVYYKFGKKAAGRILDGRTWDETPR